MPNIDYNTALGKFLVLIGLIFICSFLIDYLLSNSLIGQSYRVFVAPGIIVHELSHAFSCLITGAKIKKVSLFEKEGGKVEHYHSRVPILGPMLISLSPFVVGAVLIYFLSKKLGVSEIDLVAIQFSKAGVMDFFRETVASINFHDPKTVILFYIIVSIAVTMVPSFQDFKNAFLSLLAVGIAIFLLNFFGVYNFAGLAIPSLAFTLLSTVFLMLILFLILSIVIFAISKAVRPN